jgi:flagellar hook-basal body complex protein FliE
VTIGPVGFTPFAPIAPLATNGATAAQSAAAGESFAATLGQGLQALAGAQSKADGLAVQAATGDLQDVHAYSIAATQAQLATELTVAVRNKAVEAFNEILRMQV